MTSFWLQWPPPLHLRQARDAEAERDFFEVAQRESVAADARRGASGSQNAICLESGLLNIESGLLALESGLFELSPSGSFEFSNQSSAFDLTSDMFEATGAGSRDGGVTDAVNQLAALSQPPPIPAPPAVTAPAAEAPVAAPPASPRERVAVPPPQRQVVGIPRGLTRRGPEPGRATDARPAPTESTESFVPRVASVTGPRLQLRTESDSIEGGRYASTTSSNERVSARAVKIKVRQD